MTQGPDAHLNAQIALLQQANAVPTQIRDRLSDLVQHERVLILHAAESGSRAWGFAGPDSDWDVRFIYVRPHAEYLRVHQGRDVLEYGVDDHGIDLSGWDLRKTLALALKSNAQPLEWLASSMVYRKHRAAHTLGELCAAAMTLRGLAAHYLGLAKQTAFHNNFVSQFGEVPRRKYLYVVRPLLALKAIEARQAPPPMDLRRLITLAPPPPDVQTAINTLLEERQRPDQEKNTLGPRIPLLDEWIALGLNDRRLDDLPAEPARPLAEVTQAMDEFLFEMSQHATQMVDEIDSEAWAARRAGAPSRT
jgi:uncharacterized protein